jgi:regulator of sigma E protease
VDLFYFIVLVSSLIFVHELGHFAFAKAFGVKVLTFSLGFGPKVLRIRGAETEYCVGLLPLGGYVRMLEASKSDIVLPEDRQRTFESLALWKRILIVLAGPLMNLLFPVLLYFAVFATEGPFLAPTVGIVLPGHAAEGKLFPGDRIMEVNGEEVGTFDEVQRVISKSPGKLLRFKVFRDNKHVEVEVTVEEVIERSELDIVDRKGTIGIGSSAPAAVIGVPSAESPAYRAGLRTFDLVTHVAGRPARRFMDLEEALRHNQGETVPVTYLRPVKVPDALGGLAELAVFEPGVVALTPEPSGTTLLERTGIENADLYAAVVPEDTSFYAANLRPGDKLLRLDDEPVPAWATFKERVLRAPDRPHRFEFLSARDGRVRSGSFSGTASLHRVKNWTPLAPEARVDHPTPVRYAAVKAVEATVAATRFILVSFVRILQGRLTLQSLSGPIAIYELAGEEGRKGPGPFVWVMAVISINLGLLNLLPIPALDGGHLMFFTLEAVLRRPIPLRVREVAHIVGLAILVGLMGIAFKNDVEKHWDVIVTNVKKVTS